MLEARQEALNVYLANQDLQLCIAKQSSGEQGAGRLTSLRYRGRELLNQENAGFGAIGLVRVSDVKTILFAIPDRVRATISTYPAEGKAVVTLRAADLISCKGKQRFPVSVEIEYTLYRDSNVLFTWVTLNSSSKEWRARWVDYGQSLWLDDCPEYEVRGTTNTVLAAGTLEQAREHHEYAATHIQLTAHDPKGKVAVTLFPLGLFPPHAAVDGTAHSTKLSLCLLGARTLDAGWHEWGQYIRNLTYGTGLAVSAPEERPAIVTPWVMPACAPYGVIQSYDELPDDAFNVIQPNPKLSPATSNFWRWHQEDPKGKVNLLLTLDYMRADQTVTAEGVPNTWNVHGPYRLVNTSSAWKHWLASSDGGWLGYGMHGFHHDYPWEWEFHGVTNRAWGTSTWDHMEADLHALGVRPQIWYKAPGYSMRPEMLDVLIAHGIKAYNVNYIQPPRAVPWYLYKDDAGRSLILFSNGLSLDAELKKGKGADDIYNREFSPGLRDMGLVALTGHFFHPEFYGPWKSILDRAEVDFGIRYFLVEELVNYWQEVLLPLKYTYNSKQITRNVHDPRLTFRLLNAPVATEEGVVVETPDFTLWSPDVSK